MKKGKNKNWEKNCIFPIPAIKKMTEFYISKLGLRAIEYLACKEPIFVFIEMMLSKQILIRFCLIEPYTSMAMMYIYMQKIRNFLKKSLLKMELNSLSI